MSAVCRTKQLIPIAILTLYSLESITEQAATVVVGRTASAQLIEGAGAGGGALAAPFNLASSDCLFNTILLFPLYFIYLSSIYYTSNYRTDFANIVHTTIIHSISRNILHKFIVKETEITFCGISDIIKPSHSLSEVVGNAWTDTELLDW